MNQQDMMFLTSVKDYVTSRPEVAAHVSSFVADGIAESLKAQQAKSADMEVIISFLLRGGKISVADKLFVAAKLEKWNKLCSLNWEHFIKEQM